MENRRNIILKIATNSSRTTEKYFINNYIDIYNEIIYFYKISNIKKDILFKEKIWLWLNNELDLPKCQCGNYTKINTNFLDGFRRCCSVKCSSIDKTRIENCKKSNIDKYGTESYFNSNDFKEKSKKTNLDKFGVDHYSKTDEFKDKVKETSINKWGVDHYSKTDEYKIKVKETSNEKFGVDNYSKTDEFKDKVKETSINKWGVDNFTKTDEYKSKTQETNMKKYQSLYFLQSDIFKEKTKETILNKWGVDHYSKTDDYKIKVVNTSLSKWGVSNFTKTEEYKNKTIKTNLLRYGKKSHTLNETHRIDNYKISNDKYYLSYLNDSINLFRCDLEKDHNFEILSTTYYSRKTSNSPLCTVCYPISNTNSFKEDELYIFIDNIYSGEIIQSYRDGLEIDIYLPDLKLGFEFNGLYWHSEEYKEKNYHLDKSNYFKEKGIRIIHIWEDDWFLKKNIIKSQIKNILNKTDNKIFARKCNIKEVDIKECQKFLNNNHIQGFVKSNIKIGLYFDNELISLMSFDRFEGRKKMEEGGWNLSRFCNKLDTVVVGGASKLLKYFIDNYNPTRIVSYADKDWSIGNLYYNLGFENVNESKPDYKYIINKKRIHKSNFKKSNLNTNLTESQEMKKNRFEKIWDCGKIKFQINF